MATLTTVSTNMEAVIRS